MNLYKKAMISFIIGCIFLMFQIPVSAASLVKWNEVKGTYAKEDNSQYNSGVLSLMYLDNDVVMFEFSMMEGSESEDISRDFRLAGAFYINEDGRGIYENPKTENVIITFDLSGDKVAVKQTGALPINVSGEYSFIDDHIQVTEYAAIEILEQLPTAATSLNHNLGEYKLSMSEEMVDGWFYDVKANFVDTKALLAEFYIASDMSAVYRVDTDTPVLIWGSAQPMLDATYLADSESFYGITIDENNSNSNNDDSIERNIETGYVNLTLLKDSIAVGDSTQVIFAVPGNLPYTFTCKSSNSEIAAINDKGVITSIGDGETTITCMITIDGAEKSYELKVTSFNREAPMEKSSSTTSSHIWWIIIPVIIVIIPGGFLILKRKTKQHHVDI
jgi:hypothetical protein